MTKNGKTRKRSWALLLSAALIVTQLPAVAMAQNNAPEDGSIASFEELNSGVAKQTVDVGTEPSGMNLPDTVTASVCHVTEDMVIPDEDDSDGDSTEESDDPATASPSDAENRVSEGKYVFTADVDGSALSDSAKLPQITVTVAADTVEKPTESQPGESISCTQTEGCTLPDGHEGDCVPAPLANDGLVKTITGWRFVDDENLNEGVLPLINVNMEQQADFDTVVSMLPTQISADIEGEAAPITVNITGWTCPEYIPDGEGNWPLTGDYTFTAALADGYACDPLPTVKVLLGGANTYAANNTLTEGELTVAASNNGEVEYTAGSGFTLKASGTYEISGEWNGNLTGAGANKPKAVITVPSGVTADVTLTNVTINMSNTGHACAFAVATGGTANITLQGTNTLTSGHSRAGMEVPKAASVTIAGSGSLTATGGDSAAGIGSSNGYANQYERDAGNITISGDAEVTAQGGALAAGIGGGSNGGNAGTIKINGNTVVFATASGKGAHIGGGGNGSGQGSFTKGVVFEGEQGTVHGSPTLPGNVTIPSGSTLTVPDGSTLTIPDSITLTNSGTIENNGTVTGGSITNNGTVNDHSGGISATVTGTAANKPSEVEISFWNSQNGQITQATYGDTITVQAKVAQKNTRLRKAAPNEVIFKTGSTELGTASVTNGTATLSLTLTGDFWKAGGNTITAEYSGGASLLPNDTGTANLTVEMDLSDAAAKITAPAAGAMPEKTATVDGSANYTVQKVTWSGALAADGKFDYDTAYTAEITLNAKQYYRFANPVTGTINGQTANVSRTSDTDTEVVLSYIFDKTAVQQTWAVTVKNGTSDKATAAEGETVAITAGSAPAGQTFDKWTTADGVAFANENAASTTFIMPAKAVTVTATYKALLPNTYAVTVENGTGDGSYTKGATVNIAADNAPSGKVFERWTADSTDIIFDNPNSVSTSFIMPEHAVTVTANFKDKPSGGGSSSGNGRSTYTEPQPQSSYTVAGDNISRSVSRSDLKKLADNGKSLTLRCEKASMTFDPAALKAILAAVPATADNITFTVAPADLSAFPNAAAQIGTRPVYNFTISYKDSKGNAVKADVNFPADSASITLNYTLAAAEVTGSLFMVYVDGKGAVTWLDKSSYGNGKVLAEIPHFSTYGVAYKAPVPVFTDIANHWAKADIEFVAARGLLSDTGNNLSSPNGPMTRGMFVTALGRLAGINPDSYQTRSFTDVKTDAYYAAYVEWAAQKNIVKETGEGLFSPDAPVTREQMAVMMTNYAGQMGYSIPTPLASVTFADNANISAWAAKEVAAMQRAGIIKGKDGNRFDPQASATRAEVSAVLRRFVEIVIDPVTAQGWVKNDSGQWLYYKDGKALTGWQTISNLRYFFNADGVMHEGWKQDTGTNKWYYWTNAGAATGWKEIGGKWYYFDENGVMSVNTTIDGYEIGPDGAKK